jgi:hypothetical protein
LFVVLAFDQVSKISVVVVVENLTFFGCLAEVDRCLDHRLNNAHAGDNALNRNQLVDQTGSKAARRDVVTSKVSVEVDVVLLDLGWERLVVGLCSGLFVTSLTAVVLKVFDGVVKLVLEHVESIKRTLEYEVGKVTAELAQFIKVNAKAVVL